MNTLTTITETNPCFLCCFCKTGTVDDLNLGQLFMYDGVVTHYFCMLFSAALSQNGRDDEGILGFLPNDIMTEVRRSFRLRCTYCGTLGASVGCCNKKCRTAFHFPCGLKNGAVYQFFGNYESFCSEHVKLKEICLPKREWYCPICTSKVPTREEAIQSSCCKSAVFHKECLQKLALSSGYFFKCPLCNNGKEFVQEMRSLGIFVPEQDASWEREPNAYEDLYYQHSQCDVENCLCPKGPGYSAQKGSWMLARCRICGAAGTHKQCSNLSTVENWACEPCREVELRTEKEKESKRQALIQEGLIQPEATTSKNGDQDGQSEEAYVCARSGNRKVRNGRLQKRTAGKKHWRFSDLHISPWCFWYFPYNKQHLTYFNSKSVLPDWRNLTLRVNLVNWIPKTYFEGTADSGNDEPPVHKVTIEGITEEDRALISDSEIVTASDLLPEPRQKMKFKRKRSTRKSNWASGVIKRKKTAPRYMEWKQNKSAAVNKESNVGEYMQEDGPEGEHESPGKWEVNDPQQVLAATVIPFPDAEMDCFEPDDCTLPLFAETTIDLFEEVVPVINAEDFQLDIQSNVEISSEDLEEVESEEFQDILSPTTTVDAEVSQCVDFIVSEVCRQVAEYESNNNIDKEDPTTIPFPTLESLTDLTEELLTSAVHEETFSPTKLSQLWTPNIPSPTVAESTENGERNSDPGYQVWMMDHAYCKTSPELKDVASVVSIGNTVDASVSSLA